MEENPTLVTQRERQFMELAKLMENEKYARNQARTAALKSLYYPMDRPKDRYFTNKNGDLVQTEESIKQQEAWDRCKARCKGEELPTMWDVMNEGQAFEAITNPTSYTVIRDTSGLKPVDESKMVLQPENPYANLTMEQLELLQKVASMDEAKVAKLLEEV